MASNSFFLFFAATPADPACLEADIAVSENLSDAGIDDNT
jgi:hypothetical protein